MNTIKFKLDSLVIETFGKNVDKPNVKTIDKFYFTNNLKEKIGVLSSDETIIFILDNKTKGAIRLTKESSENYDLKEIIASGISNFSLNPKTAKVYFGPSITFSHCETTRDALLKHIKNGYPICAKRTAKVDYLDLLTLNFSILNDFGFSIRNVYFSDFDTFENDDLLYSKIRGDTEENLTIF